MPTSTGASTKAETLTRWTRLPDNQPVRPRPVPYKHQGSTYGEDAIRITGTPEFIDAVMSRLKDLIAAENRQTRLQLSRQPCKDKDTGRPLTDEHGQPVEAVYIQVHERGPWARIY